MISLLFPLLTSNHHSSEVAIVYPDQSSSKLPLRPIGCLVIRGQRSVAIEAAAIHAGPTPTQGIAVAPLAALVAIVDGIPGRKQKKRVGRFLRWVTYINHWKNNF